MNHFRTFLFLFFSCILLLPAEAQFIVKEQVFPVAGYNIFDIGYPGYVAKGKDGQFVFLEYWAEGIEGHRISNFYLESYDSRTFTEHWFKPITNEGFDPMLGLLDVVSLDEGIYVLGYQNFKKDRITHTVGRYFDYEGRPISGEPVKISNFDKTAKKGFYDKIATSPGGKCMLWMGTDEKRYFMSVWKGNGSKLWDKEMELPWVKEKYYAKDIAIDDKGNPYMLLMHQKPSYSFKDTASKPLLVYYDWKNDSLYTETVSIDYAYALNAHLELVNNVTVTVSGVSSDEGPNTVLNGVKFMKNPHKWTHFFFRKYERGPGLKQIRKRDTPIPEEWRDTYFVSGSNFSKSQVLSVRNHLVMLFEENFVSGGKVYYFDIGCVGFDMKTGEVLWTQTVQKRQRDSGSGSFLSYLPIIAKGRLWMVYLTERGAAGKLMCTSVYLDSGKKVDKTLASNSEAQYLFFPELSGTVGGLMILVGMGDPGRNDFKLISIAF